jgi:hypothetical protein
MILLRMVRQAHHERGHTKFTQAYAKLKQSPLKRLQTQTKLVRPEPVEGQFQHAK